MRNKTVNMAAVINIGANLVKMRVSKLENDELVDIDNLEKPINVGHEIFNDKKISFETLREISKILGDYSQICKEYGITNYKVIADTLLKEAENCDYVIDQLKIQNNMLVEIFEDRQEKSLIYFEMINKIEKYCLKETKNTLFSYIDAGSIGLALCDDGDMFFSQNISMGTVKLHDILEPVQEKIIDFHQVLEEYVNRMLERVELPREKTSIKNLVISSVELELISRLMKVEQKEGVYVIKADIIEKFYSEINTLTASMISSKYNITMNEAEMIFISLTIYLRILKLTNSRQIMCPKTELLDAVIRQLLSPKMALLYEEHVRRSAINCAKTLAKKFYFSKNHIDLTYEYATLIFDKMRKIHGLNKRKRLLLELAIVLHESGYYANSKDPRRSTFDIIKSFDLYGLTDRDIILMANISNYNEFTQPSNLDPEYIKLSQKEKLAVSKMVAIFRISNAIDKSKKQKFKSVKVRLKSDKLTITASSDENVYLEKWAIDKCVPFFQEVFGVKVEFIVKTLLF